MRLVPRLQAIFALFGLGLTAAVGAQGTAPATLDESDAAFLLPSTEDTSLLWQISGDDLSSPSFIFGTIHLIPAEDYFLQGHVVRAINDVDEVLFEVDPREMTNPANMMGMMNKINMRNDTSLRDLLSEARYDSVSTYFNDLGLPFMFFERMKPMFLSAMVGQDMGAGNPFGGMGGDDSEGGGTKSYELELVQIAEAGDKEIGGLETIDFQLGLFDSIPYSVQAEMLFKAIDNDLNAKMQEGDSQYEQMVAMYKRKSVAEMSALISSESEGFGDFEEMLVTRRNENWVPNIIGRLADKPSMYAVGAGHLGGEHGVIALLRAEGYTVEPVYE
ncbi:TraB/GumN family protein [Lewinella sp. IMCC34191]|uniref:TraB/GumN family protein n=1 Tax=Lewinella sp. IMCC34191 TaxID=2259172 RepID=UPI000E23E329|nr:TraB/GumN family protein [Lewinella sp. IMCC34191]